MRVQHIALAVVAACLAGAGSPSGQSPLVSPVAAPNDYADPKSWLCRPGRQDACAVDLTTTIVAADGGFTRETWAADPDAPVDCFYVYPTVSTDATAHSDMIPDPAEANVVRIQFARFASRCRVYAPVYRQVTLSALRTALASGGRVELVIDHPHYWTFFVADRVA